MTEAAETQKTILGLEDVLPECQSYHYAKDFSTLWDLASTDNKESGDSIKIIFWDGIPSPKAGLEVVSTAEYLTPVDWAVAYSLARREGAGIRILIVDWVSKTLSHAQGLTFFRQAPSVMPWICVLAPHENLIATALTMPKMGDVQESTLPVLRSYWRSILLQPDRTPVASHHALANIIGPLLLLPGGVPGDACVRTKALHTFLTRLDQQEDNRPESRSDSAKVAQSPDGSESKLKSIDVFQISTELKEKFSGLSCKEKPLQCLLIDDCAYTYHWGDVLCGLLGAGERAKTEVGGAASKFEAAIGSRTDQPHLKVFAEDDPLSILEGLPKTDGKTPDLRFSFQIGDMKPDILFLDLRLTPGAGESHQNYFRKLLCLAKQFKVESEGSMISKEGHPLPMPGISSADINEVEEAIKNESAKTESVALLTLLPRVLALMDLSLPIVLFSSTGRRDIVKKLADYPNIITEFEKPRVGSQDLSNARIETVSKFERALQTTSRLLTARKKCERLLEKSPLNCADQFLWDPNEKKPDRLYVSIFIDEHGSVHDEENLAVGAHKSMRLGALIVVGNSDKLIETLESEMNKEFPYARIAGGKNNIRDNLKTILPKLRCVALKEECSLAFASVNGTPADIITKNKDPIQHVLQFDNFYFRLFQGLLELSVFSLLRAQCVSELVVSVYAPTRQLPPGTDRANHIRKSLFSKLGIETVYVGKNRNLKSLLKLIKKTLRSLEGNKELKLEAEKFYRNLQSHYQNGERAEEVLRSVAYDTPRWLFESVRLRYPDNVPQVRVEQCRAHTINSHGESKSVLTLHYIVDGLVHVKNVETVKVNFDTYLDMKLSPEFDRFLTANSQCATGHVAEGLALLPENIESLGEGGKFLLPGFTQSLSHISGRDFGRLAALIAADSRRKTVAPNEKFTGVVEFVHRDGYAFTATIERIGTNAFIRPLLVQNLSLKKNQQIEFKLKSNTKKKGWWVAYDITVIP